MPGVRSALSDLTGTGTRRTRTRASEVARSEVRSGGQGQTASDFTDRCRFLRSDLNPDGARSSACVVFTREKRSRSGTRGRSRESKILLVIGSSRSVFCRQADLHPRVPHQPISRSRVRYVTGQRVIALSEPGEAKAPSYGFPDVLAVKIEPAGMASDTFAQGRADLFGRGSEDRPRRSPQHRTYIHPRTDGTGSQPGEEHLPIPESLTKDGHPYV